MFVYFLNLFDNHRLIVVNLTNYFYLQLIRKTEDKLLSLLPSKDKQKYLSINSTPSRACVDTATDELLQWQQEIAKMDNNLSKNKSTEHKDNNDNSYHSFADCVDEILSKSKEKCVFNKIQIQKIVDIQTNLGITNMSEALRKRKAG